VERILAPAFYIPDNLVDHPIVNLPAFQAMECRLIYRMWVRHFRAPLKCPTRWN